MDNDYLDATPQWAGLMPLLIERAAAGDAFCKSELLRLARIADRIIDANKAAKAEGKRMADENPEMKPAAAYLIATCWSAVLSRLTDAGYQPAAGRDRAADDREFKAAIGRYLAHWELNPIGENKQER